MSAYAAICTECHHPESRHLLIGGAPDLNGPYRCHYGDRSPCGCEISVAQVSEEIDRAEFERRFPDWPVEP